MRLAWIPMVCLALTGCSKGKDPAHSPPASGAALGNELVGEWLSERDQVYLNLKSDRGIEPLVPNEGPGGGWSVPSPGVLRIQMSVYNSKPEDGTYEIKDGKLLIRADGETRIFVRILPEQRQRLLTDAANRAKTTGCMANVKGLASAVILFVNQNRKLPESLRDLADKVPGPKSFRCPLTGKDDAYEMVRIADTSSASIDTLLIFERDPHPDGKRCVATWGGSVVVLEEAAFQKALKEGKVVVGE